MTMTQQPAALRTSILSPVVTAAFGFVVYALSMIAGEVFEVNMDSRLEPASRTPFWESVTESGPEFAIGLVGVAIAVWAGRRAWLGQPSRWLATAVVLAVVAAVTRPGVLGRLAERLRRRGGRAGPEGRRRIGSLDAAAGTALALGSGVPRRRRDLRARLSTQTPEENHVMKRLLPAVGPGRAAHRCWCPGVCGTCDPRRPTSRSTTTPSSSPPASTEPCVPWAGTFHEVRSGEIKLVTVNSGPQTGEVHVNGVIAGFIEYIPDDTFAADLLGHIPREAQRRPAGVELRRRPVADRPVPTSSQLAGTDGSSLRFAMSGKVTRNGCDVVVDRFNSHCTCALAIAVIAFSLGLYGYRARRRRRPGWPPHHAIGMGGSYIAPAHRLLRRQRTLPTL